MSTYQKRKMKINQQVSLGNISITRLQPDTREAAETKTARGDGGGGGGGGGIGAPIRGLNATFGLGLGGGRSSTFWRHPGSVRSYHRASSSGL